MTDMTFNQWLQSRLTAHGFPVGPIDGEIGKNTTDALKAFEKAHGLDIDGTADPSVVQALRAPSSSVSPLVMTQIPNRDVIEQEATALLMNWPRQADCTTFYGAVGTNQTQIEIPFDMYLAWAKSTRISKMTLNKKVADSAKRILEKVAQTYTLADRKSLGLDMFGGSLNVRKMRGGSAYSMHSWGIAIDFDPERNQLSWGAPKARLSHADAVPFWKLWEAEGWLSLGRAKNFDYMHVQAARL